MANSNSNNTLILVTGATGYVGGRVMEALQSSGRRVRCLARRPELLPQSGGAEVVQGDMLDPESLKHALEGVHTAYYLVHSMGSSGSFEGQDREAAQNFSDAARAAGVSKIIYLGGLGDSSQELSPHLRSRHEVGEILRSSGLTVIEFRASLVIGAGSLSFEMVRALVERLPIMIAPRWVSVAAQPIAIGDLLTYMLDALNVSAGQSHIFEIGGADQVSYGDLMREYARQRGLKRLIIPVPLLTPRLSSLWLGLVTPLFVRVGRKLIDSIRHPTVIRDHAAAARFSIRPLGYRESIAMALEEEDRLLAAANWGGAQAPVPMDRIVSRLIDSRSQCVNAPPEETFAPILRIGGKSGWYYADWLWRLRGAMDNLIGGVGLRRGRRDANDLRVGDIVDFWRVEAFEPNRRLRLAAEMKLPGRAWLDFEVEASATGSVIRQTAIYDPVGLLGRAYWYLVLPLHHVVFAGMLRGIAARAQARRAR